ncbi:MAG TPA: hypothetical protein DCR71_03760, partial [Dehalococcoidia bacterium]|nr:hypothetical protein [Dehalococcoidia bacterium]
MYTPVAQRKTTISPVVGGGTSPVSGGGYVPVAKRIATVPTATPTIPNQIDVNLNFGATTKSTPQFIAPKTPTPISMAGSLIKETGQSIARSLASVSLSAVKNVAKVVAPDLAPSAHLKPEDFKSFFGQALAETILGKDYNDKGIFSVKPVEQIVADTIPRIKGWQKETEKLLDTPNLSPSEKLVVSLLSNFSPSFTAGVGVVGNIGLDLTGYGGLEKNVLKDMVKIGTEGDGIKLLLKLGVDEQLAKTMGIEVAKVASEKEAKGLFDSIVKLQATTKSASTIARAYTPVAERTVAQQDAQKSFLTSFNKTYNSGSEKVAMETALDKVKAENKLKEERSAYIKSKAGEPKSYSEKDIADYNNKALKAGKEFDQSKAVGEVKPLAQEAGKYKMSDKIEAMANEQQIIGRNLNQDILNKLVNKGYDRKTLEGMSEGQLMKTWNESLLSKTKSLTAEVKPAIKVGDTFESGVKNYQPTAQTIQNKIAAETGRIIKTEEQLIKDSLRAEARGLKIGLKVGAQEARESIINQLKNTFDTKLAGVMRDNQLAVLKTKIVGRDADRVRTEIVDYVKQNIPIKDQGKFIVMVKNSKTQNDLIKSFLRIDETANKIAVKDAITTLKKTVDRFAESPSVSADYRKKIKDIINQYELTGHTGATIKKLEATQAYLDGIKAAGGETYIPDKILEKLQILSRTPRNKLTLSQVQGLQNEIELMTKLGQTKWASKQALYEGEKALRKQALLESATPINSLLSAKGAIGDDPKRWAEAYIKTRNYLQKTNIGLKPIDGLADITGMQPMKQALDLNYGNFIDRNIPEVADFKK